MSITSADDDRAYMAAALRLALRGTGRVEPNPMVGCMIVNDGSLVGMGYHKEFGGRHAEAHALSIATASVDGATVYVTLEPCCLHGKTPPCTEALVNANVARVVVGTLDPNPAVNGKGVGALRSAGITVDVGVMEEEARDLIAPFAKLTATGRPWVIAKWAMTLDGKLASRSGSSQWISSADSRAIAHRLRGRVDAIIVGRGTVEADDPLLTARPPGPRTATRVILDRNARLADDSRLVQSAGDAPVAVVIGPQASADDRRRLEQRGVEVLPVEGADESSQLEALLLEMGRRQWTNVLFEGGAKVLGALFDLGAIDEVHAFVASKLVGGEAAPSPIGGRGVEQMADAVHLKDTSLQTIDGDVYLTGRVATSRGDGGPQPVAAGNG